jgi:hypothetical protein
LWFDGAETETLPSEYRDSEAVLSGKRIVEHNRARKLEKNEENSRGRRNVSKGTPRGESLMESMLLLIPVFIAIAIVIRLMAGGMNHERIKNYVEARGGQIIDSAWAPFGPGWLGEKIAAIYAVRYRDRDNNVHEAHCKTSLSTGVYFTEDRIVEYAERPDTPPSASFKELEAENHRLREDLEKIRRQQNNTDRSIP